MNVCSQAEIKLMTPGSAIGLVNNPIGLVNNQSGFVIVSIPDLCPLSYFATNFFLLCTNFIHMLNNIIKLIHI